MTLTKIIVTLGPKSENFNTICNLIDAGANVFRLNLKHNTLEWHQSVISKIKKATKLKKKSVGILLDFPDLDLKSTLKRFSLAVKEEVDFLAISLIKTKNDIDKLKNLAKKFRFSPTILAKIETKEALKNLDSIIDSASGIMVARGDLGKSIPIEKVPFYQKQIIKKCIEKGKPVVVATQMLISMVNNPSPTRAEVSDVANAILDYTDAVMLSEETAIGKYPIEAVKIMKKICEFWERKRSPLPELSLEFPNQTSLLCYSAYQIWRNPLYAKENVKAFVILTKSGATAHMLSRLRPNLPIFAFTPDKRLKDRLCLVYGIIPIYFPIKSNIYSIKTSTQIKKLLLKVKKEGNLKKGDLVIMLYAEDWKSLGRANVLRIQNIP
jgi:pyruvate kinase